jgi:site-specific recombinase XerD
LSCHRAANTDLTPTSESDRREQGLQKRGLQLLSVIEQTGERAGLKFVEFFIAQISNDNTHKANGRAVARFVWWCKQRVLQLEEIGPNIGALHVRKHDGSDATVKQHLAVLRKLYEWLVTQQVVPENPFSSVRGLTLVRNEGEIPALTSEEVRALFSVFEEEDAIVALRDRALIGTMLYTFGRVSAVVNMRVTRRTPSSSPVQDGHPALERTDRFARGTRSVFPFLFDPPPWLSLPP